MNDAAAGPPGPESGPAPALVVRADRLRAARGVTVATGVELTAASGDVVAVEGPNGSGKSTLLAAAAGLLPAGRGSRRPRSVGYAPERADVLTRMPLRPWLVGLARTAGLSRAESARQADDLIGRLGLTPVTARPLRALSRGNMQRALVAQALVGPPKLLVLDEPSGGLDADGLGRVAAEIERAASQSVVLVARHPTAPVPLPPGSVWRIGDGTVAVTDRPATATVQLEIETGDGRIRSVPREAVPSVLRAALDAGVEVRRVQPLPGVAEVAAGPGAPQPRRAGPTRRLLAGAVHRSRLLAISQWFAAPALLFLALLGAIYASPASSSTSALSGPAFTAVALAIVMTWVGVLAHMVDGRVVARAFGAHVGGPGRAHLAACLAAVPFGLVATAAAVIWPAVTGQPGHWTSVSFLAEVASLQLAAMLFGIGIATLLVPPLIQTTGWRVCLAVALYLALVLIPDSPLHPILRLSVGTPVTGGPALAATLLALIGLALIALTTPLANHLP